MVTFNRTLPHSQLRLAPDANASQPRYERVSTQMRLHIAPGATKDISPKLLNYHHVTHH